jgi:hypothetical protein
LDDGRGDYNRHALSFDQQGWQDLGYRIQPKVIWGVVKQKANDCEIPSLAPHDLRRTCARLCHQAGGQLEQIQFLLGHVSVQTTERYLGCKQRFRHAVMIGSGSNLIWTGRDLRRSRIAGRLNLPYRSGDVDCRFRFKQAFLPATNPFQGYDPEET